MKLHSAIQEALAAHELFRRLGYQANEIYVMPPVPVRPAVFVVLRAQGREFKYSAGQCDVMETEFLPQWEAAVKWWNEKADEAKEERRKSIYHESFIVRHGTDLLVKLGQMGFTWEKPHDA